MTPEKIRPRYSVEQGARLSNKANQYLAEMTFKALEKPNFIPNEERNISPKDMRYIDKALHQLDFALSGHYRYKANGQSSPVATKDSSELKKIIQQNIGSGLVSSSRSGDKIERFSHSEQFLNEQSAILSDSDFRLPQDLTVNPQSPDIRLVPPESIASLRQLVRDIKTLAGNNLKCYEIIDKINDNLNKSVLFHYTTVDQKTGLLRRMDDGEAKQFDPSYDSNLDISKILKDLADQGIYF